MHPLVHRSIRYLYTFSGDGKGEKSNIQDGSVLHTDKGLTLTVGRGVSVGRSVMLHGCQIGDHCLIGMRSVILNRAGIGDYCMIGANSLITMGQVIPDRSLALGSPAKAIRPLTESEIEQIRSSAARYLAKAGRYPRELARI